jgi:hypothetical protein
MTHLTAEERIAEKEKHIRNIKKMRIADVQVRASQEFRDEVGFHTDVIAEANSQTQAMAKDLRALRKSHEALGKVRKTGKRDDIVMALDVQILGAEGEIAHWAALREACSEMLQEARMLSPQEWKAAKIEAAQDEIDALKSGIKMRGKSLRSMLAAAASGIPYKEFENKILQNPLINDQSFNNKAETIIQRHFNDGGLNRNVGHINNSGIKIKRITKQYNNRHNR